MIVWPSGGDFTTTSVPIVPDAPGLFSTKKGWSQRACSLGASKRATMSGPAAGGIDVVGQAGAVLERKPAEIGEAAEHRPDAGREFRFDAAELRIQIHDLWHSHRCRLTVSVPFDR